VQSTTNHAWSMVHRAPPDHLHRRNKRRGPTPTRPQLASLPAAAAPDHHFHSARAPAPLPRHMPPGVRDHLICCPVVVWWAPRARRDGRVPVFRRGAPRGRTGAAWHPVFRAPSRGGRARGGLRRCAHVRVSRGVFFPGRGPNPATSPRLLRRCVVPVRAAASIPFRSIHRRAPISMPPPTQRQRRGDP
jgi:hypothetical protein